MTRLESNKVVIAKKPEEVFGFLSDFNNIGKLMPEQVIDFKTEGETCSFTIKGMATLGLTYESKKPFESVVMKSHGKVPFDFTLSCAIEPIGEESTLTLYLDAALNPFLKMMAEKPLTNFLNLLAAKYRDIAGAET
jgi:carbon monoxide dehydrogenase subunit G